jgi:hypothetical protein
MILIGLEIEWDETAPEGLIRRLIRLCNRKKIHYIPNPKPSAKLEIPFTPRSFEENIQLLHQFRQFFPHYPKYCRVHINISGIDTTNIENRLIPIIKKHAYTDRLDDKRMGVWFKDKGDHTEIRPGAVSRDITRFLELYSNIYLEVFPFLPEVKRIIPHL